MTVEHQPNPEESMASAAPELLKYHGDATSFAFSHPGQKLVWDSTDYLTSPDISPLTRVLITTVEGEQYLIRDSLAIDLSVPGLDQGKGIVDLGVSTEALPDMTIGRPAYIPGLGETEAVDNVLVQYKIGSFPEAMEIDAEDPFQDIDVELKFLNAQAHFRKPIE